MSQQVATRNYGIKRFYTPGHELLFPLLVHLKNINFMVINFPKKLFCHMIECIPKTCYSLRFLLLVPSVPRRGPTLRTLCIRVSTPWTRSGRWGWRRCTRCSGTWACRCPAAPGWSGRWRLQWGKKKTFAWRNLAQTFIANSFHKLEHT